MPYLAPYLIKGYVEAHSSHRVDCLDLNVAFSVDVWTGGVFRYTCDEALSKRTHERIAIVREWGPRAYAAMRNAEMYDDVHREQLLGANDVLRGAELLEQEISLSLGSHAEVLPRAFGQWPELLTTLERSLCARFLYDRLSEIPVEHYGVIGFSCSYLEQLSYCLLLARELRRRFGYRGRLVIGGSGFTHIHHFALRDSDFWQSLDYGIPFEGEVSLLSLLNGLENHDSEFAQDNIIVSRPSGIHFTNRIHERPVAHPAPDFSGLQHLFPTPEPIYPLLTSKGCYWGKCAFCTHHEGYGQGYSPGDNRTIRESILHVIRHGGRCFYFVDEALPAAKIRHVASVFDEFRQDGSIEDPAWMAECRVEKYSAREEYLQNLAASGCRLLINGMETGSQRVMALMKKGVEIHRAREYAIACHKAGIRTAWMFFIGFPGETAEEARLTFDLLEACKDDIDFATVGTFALERGSPIWEHPDQYGIAEILGADDPYRVVFDYRDMHGRVHTRRALKEALITFLTAYPSHLPLFRRIVERSCALFFPRPVRDEMRSGPPS